MSNDLKDLEDGIEELIDNQDDIKAVVKTVNAVVGNVNAITEYISKIIGTPKISKTIKEDVNAIWEYVLLYFVLLFSLMFGLYPIAPIMIYFPILASVLTSTLLVGAIKEFLWKIIRNRNRTIEEVKAEKQGMETALSAQSIQLTAAQNKVIKLVNYIQKKDPLFTMDKLINNQKFLEQITVPDSLKYNNEISDKVNIN